MRGSSRTIVYPFLAVGVIVCLTVIHALAPAPEILFSSDSSTLLFEDYEGTTRSDTRSASALFAAGYLGGQALHLSDTSAFCEYADTWWNVNAQNFQESGTIECYFRPDTFLWSANRGYGLLLHMFERPTIPAVTGYPAFGVFQGGDLSWGISYNSGSQQDYHATPFVGEAPLYPGQWYHVAATWGASTLKMFINGIEAGSFAGDTEMWVRKERFQVGAPGTVGGSKGWAARGRIDRLRISSRTRSAAEFPSALDVRIDTPNASSGSLARPFVVQYRAYATETRPRVVDLYAETTGVSFGGILLARDLPESGTALVGAGLLDTDYYLYAVARAGGDSAFHRAGTLFTMTSPVGYAAVVDPAETTATVGAAVSTVESFTIVLLNNGGTTAAPLRTYADSSGRNANYSIAVPLAESGPRGDTVAVKIWTRETQAGIAVAVRRDTGSLWGSRLPSGVGDDAIGRRALGNTAILLEFLRPDGTMIGDSRTTSQVGDSFAFTLEYRLSETTAGLFGRMGFDTAPGSRAFRFYFADTYGAAWTEDTTCTVTVGAGSDGVTIVTIAGLTRDLPGGLGGIGPQSILISSQESHEACILSEWGVPRRVLVFLRFLREKLLTSRAGRILVLLYYLLG